MGCQLSIIFQTINNEFVTKMERANGYLMCTFCKRHFFTKIGFQIHKTEEHPQEEAKPTNCFLESDKKVDHITVKGATSDHEEKYLLKTEGNSEAFVDKTSNANKVVKHETLQNESKTTLLKTAAKVAATMPKKINNNHFRCKACQKGFKLEIELRRHIQQQHEKNQYFQCRECDKKFTFKTKLKRHKNEVHDKSMPFKCQECDKKFTRKDYLIIHSNRKHFKIKTFQSVHDKIKSIQSQECDKHLISKSYLKTHTNRVHDNIKTFQCRECDKKFNLKSNLKRHKNTVHYKIKPFQCKYCTKNFTCNRNLKLHILKIHEES